MKRDLEWSLPTGSLRRFGSTASRREVERTFGDAGWLVQVLALNVCVVRAAVDALHGALSLEGGVALGLGALLGVSLAWRSLGSSTRT
jgi:hypothetical protein